MTGSWPRSWSSAAHVARGLISRPALMTCWHPMTKPRHTNDNTAETEPRRRARQDQHSGTHRPAWGNCPIRTAISRRRRSHVAAHPGPAGAHDADADPAGDLSELYHSRGPEAPA